MDSSIIYSILGILLCIAGVVPVFEIVRMVEVQNYLGALIVLAISALLVKSGLDVIKMDTIRKMK